MRNSRVWQGATVFLAVLVLSFAPSAGEGGPAFNPEQIALLDEFLAFRPPGAAGDGVWMLSEWDSDAGLGRFVTLPSGAGNAAILFRRLEELFPSEKTALEANGAGARGVQLLVEAADMAECRLSPDVYPEFDRITAKQPDFVVLRTYLKGLQDRAALSERRGDSRDAERCHRAAILCGRHLTRDKSSAILYLTGLIFKLRGTKEYENFLRRAGRQAEADAARDYAAGLAVLLRAFNWKANEILSRMGDFASLPVALRVAAEDREPCWRKEALFRLGMFRFGAMGKDAASVRRSPEFERAAERALSRAAATDPDSSVRRFAVWVAMNVKPERYGELEHRF